jgi:hypothetical protein
MMKLLKGEGWVELLFALIAISLFAIWLVTIMSSRLSSMGVWESWQSQQKAPAVERVVAQPSATANGVSSEMVAVK